MIKRPAHLTLLVAIWAGACANEAAVTEPASGWVPPPSATVMAYADCLEAKGVSVTERIAAVVIVNGAANLAEGKRACHEELTDHLKTVGGKERKVKDERTKTFIDMLRWCTNYRGKWDQPAEDPVFDKAVDAERTRVFYACIEEIRTQPTQPAEDRP